MKESYDTQFRDPDVAIAILLLTSVVSGLAGVFANHFLETQRAEDKRLRERRARRAKKSVRKQVRTQERSAELLTFSVAASSAQKSFQLAGEHLPQLREIRDQLFQALRSSNPPLVIRPDGTGPAFLRDQLSEQVFSLRRDLVKLSNKLILELMDAERNLFRAEGLPVHEDVCDLVGRIDRETSRQVLWVRGALVTLQETLHGAPLEEIATRTEDAIDTLERVIAVESDWVNGLAVAAAALAEDVGFPRALVEAIKSHDADVLRAAADRGMTVSQSRRSRKTRKKSIGRRQSQSEGEAGA